MKLLITGSNGYLGKRLVNHLLNEHDLILPIRNNSQNLSDNLRKNSFFYRDYVELRKIFLETKPDIILNTVAKYGRNDETLDDLVEANLTYPIRIFEFAMEANSKFINIGSALPENTSAYALLKNTFVKLINLRDSPNFINLKVEHFYGSNDVETKFINYVFENCIKNNEIELTSCDQVRDFIYIKDLVSAINVIIDNVDHNSHNEFEIGSGVGYLLKDVISTIHTVTQSTSKLKFGVIDKRKNEPMESIADISKISELGWKPNYSFESGIKEMYKNRIS